jgi:glycosyltransferase involved in cell wall biosynthesis
MESKSRLSKAPVSLIVLTYNEEANITHTLESVMDWLGEIIIVDSFSTDRTLEICRRYTDKIYQHPFENQAKQFNWALDNVPIAYDWVMRLDADEVVTPELSEEICDLLGVRGNGLGDVTGMYLKRRVYFMGRWMKHGDYYPMWFLRIFRKGKGRYEDITEEHIVLSGGRAVRLKNDFIDYNRKGLSFWTDKHAHWAIGEMLDVLSMMGQGALPAGTVRPALCGSQEQRRRWLKTRVYARLPLFFRAFAFFFYRYVICFGFLDGREGLIFHFLQGCWYRFYVDAKIYEAKKFGVSEAEKSVGYSASKPWEAGPGGWRPEA